MQRRLDLAAALVHEPRVLFLDEPTTGLDPVSRKTIWEEVRALNDEGTTVFLTTQYLEEADQLADHVGIIDSGRIVAEGTPESLKAEIGHPHIQLQLAEGAIAEAEEVCAPDRQAAAAARTARRCWSRSRTAPPTSRASCGRSTRPGSRSESLELVRPTLDDVFVAKTGYHLEEEERGERREGPGRGVSAARRPTCGWSGRWACARSARPSAARS